MYEPYLYIRCPRLDICMYKCCSNIVYHWMQLYIMYALYLYIRCPWLDILMYKYHPHIIYNLEWFYCFHALCTHSICASMPSSGHCMYKRHSYVMCDCQLVSAYTLGTWNISINFESNTLVKAFAWRHFHVTSFSRDVIFTWRHFHVTSLHIQIQYFWSFSIMRTSVYPI